MYRASTRGNDPAGSRNQEFSPARGGSLNRGVSRINDYSPGAGISKSKTNLDNTAGSSMARELQKQTTQGVNFRQGGNFSKTTVSRINTTTQANNAEVMSFSPDSRRKSRLSALDQESVQFATNN